MFNRRVFKTLTLVFCLTMVLGWASNAFAAPNAFRWKFATLAPKNLGWANQTQGLVLPWFSEATDGNLKVKIYWGGVMGNDQEYLKKMRIGQLQGAGISGAGAIMACPEITILGLPFLFNNYEEVDYIRHVMYPTFDYYFAQHGTKLLMLLDQDFDQVYSTKYPMNNLEDWKNARFQNWYGKLETATIEALGGHPVATTVLEGHSGFKTGTIDASFGPAVYMVGSQLYTLFKYVNPMKLRYACGAIVVNLDSWEALPQEYQGRLIERRDEVTNLFNQGTRDENARCLEGMIHYGVKPVELSPEVKSEMVRRTMPIYNDLADDLYPRDLLVELQRNLLNFRNGKVSMATASPQPVRVRKQVMEETLVAVDTELEAKPVAKPAPKPVVKPAPKPVAKPAPAPVESKKQAQNLLSTYGSAYKESIEADKKATEKQLAAPAPKKQDKKKQMSTWQKRRYFVREVQKVLQPMGYYPSRIDGIFGPITYKGILGYQRDHGLAQTGVIDQPLLDAMGIKDPE